jgi:hypothetical protein
MSEKQRADNMRQQRIGKKEIAAELMLIASLLDERSVPNIVARVASILSEKKK